jgi:hypothetical protein
MRDATAIKKNWDEHPAVQAILIIFSGTPGSGTSFIPHRSSSPNAQVIYVLHQQTH